MRRLYAFYQSGISVERLMRRYPQLGAAKILDALAFALDNPEVIEADLTREDELLKKQGLKPRSRKPAGQVELPFTASSTGQGRGG